MNTLEIIAFELKQLIESSSLGDSSKPTILFCGCDFRLKRDMHKRAKRIGLNPSYAIKHPTIKVELQNARNKIIERDKFKTTTMDYEHFELIIKYLES
tara:strand:- start:1666 stop:1959 length:294 start_codon:yes stop_codon:yes gene_type:complete